jgi:hypothetical protein
MTAEATMLWRRLDGPGHDACRLMAGDDGWRLEGVAAFQHDGAPACLAYEIHADAAWRTRAGAVRGWVGRRPVDVRIARTPAGRWMVDGDVVPGVDGCVDLDLGFTPATNVLQLRRVALEVGQSAAVPVAWLDVPPGPLQLIDQRYERRTAQTYWYESPRFAYAALLRVGAAGFVEDYPDLWQAVG